MFATYIIYTCLRRHIIVCICSQHVDVNLVKWRSVACETLSLTSWPIITTAEATPCLGIIVICTDNIYNIYISQYYLIDNMYICTYIYIIYIHLFVYIYTYLITWQASGRVSVTCIPDLLPRCHVAKVQHLAERWRGRFLTHYIAGQSGLTPIEFPIE